MIKDVVAAYGSAHSYNLREDPRTVGGYPAYLETCVGR
jgi:hypothetical protein